MNNENTIERQLEYSSLSSDFEKMRSDSSEKLTFEAIFGSRKKLNSSEEEDEESDSKRKKRHVEYTTKDFVKFISEANKFFNLNLDNIVELSVVISFILSTDSPYQVNYNSSDSAFTKYFSSILVHSALVSLKDKGYIIETPWIDSSRCKETEYSLNPAFLNVLSENCFDGSSYGKKLGKSTSKAKVSKELKIDDPHILKYTALSNVKLAMPESIKGTLTKIEDTLTGKNYEKVIKRINKGNSGNCICISLQGVSGTGKTETVYQLARKTKRDIYKYDAAESESPYYGAQSKALNEMFDTYQAVCKRYEDAGKSIPILLLNEADAIFTKRSDNGDGSPVAREINALQAELLNKLDSFNGILFITTNIAHTFDDAMERRFLFKVNFENPDKETQKEIWKMNFSDISDIDIDKLAEKFNMTGGNIANVKKKLEMDYVISGESYNLDSIVEACKSEKKEQEEKRHIGFDTGD